MELNSVYITSKNAARHIKKSLSKKIIFPETEGGGGGEKSLRDEEETSVISLTTMSSEAALAITNEKTIKDEDKDKLKWLVFMVIMMKMELECGRQRRCPLRFGGSYAA